MIVIVINYNLKSYNLIIRLYDVMSNQSNDGFQGSQPFITDKQYQNLSLAELKHILEEEKESLKKNYKELDERKK